MKPDGDKPGLDEGGVVVPFRARTPPPPVRAFSNLASDRSPVEDVEKYTRKGAEPDDYAHRMKMNALAVVFLAGLAGAGIWIIDVMAQQRKNQDCALSGRRNCAPIEVPVEAK